MVQGVDVTEYKRIPKSVDYFFDIEDEMLKYIANIDKDGYGLLQTSTGRLRSRKLFSWGNGEASDHWQEFLTDQAGRYLEIQAGLGKTQYGCIPMAPHTAWEWLEQYGPASFPEAAKANSHKEREEMLTEALEKANCAESMEQKLKDTKAMATGRAKLVMAGSGYGALAQRGRWSEHLEFTISSDSLKKWKEFFETGVLHKPDPKLAPDEFLIEADNLDFLVNTLETSNKENWYAYYQAGIGYFTVGDYGQAERCLRRSNDLEANPWACHALACICLMGKDSVGAADWMSRGLSMESQNISYLKEALKILYHSGAYKKIVEFYENLKTEIQQVGKLKYYYIAALNKLGEVQRAYDTLEEDGGLVIDDIREGEDSISQLWSELSEKLWGEKKKVPYKYDFMAS